MAIDDSYAVAADYRAVMLNTDTRRDEEVDEDLLTISRIIEKKVKTFFNKDEALVDRFYTPEFRIVNYGSTSGIGWAESENPWRYTRGNPSLWIDPIADTTGLVIVVDTDRDGDFSDETPLTTNDYILLPRNALVGPEPKPYQWIDRRNGFWTPGCEVKITAKWGWPNVPIAIKRATIHLCSILRVEGPRATRRISEIEGTIETSKACNEILDTLMSAYSRKVPL